MPTDAEKKLEAALRGDPQENKAEPEGKDGKGEEELDEETETEEETEGDEPEEEAEEEETDEGDDAPGEDEEEGDEESEDEESEEESGKAPKTRRPRKYIPKDDYDRRKKAWDTEKATLQKQLDEAKAESKKAGTAKLREGLMSKLKERDPKLDTDSLSIIIDGIMEEVKESYGKISPELQQKLDDIGKFMEDSQGERDKAQANSADRRAFSNGWNDILPEIKSAYPGATSDELEAAKELLGKVWRTKEFYKLDVFRVFSKSKAKFDDIMSPHEKGFETGRPSPGESRASSKGGKVSLSDNPSKKEIDAVEKRLAEVSAEPSDLEESDGTL